MENEALKAHKIGMRRLLETGEHSDLILSCSDGKTFNVHKAIVCAQSEFFSKACRPERFEEGYNGQVDLEIGDSTTIAKLLEYLYVLEYDDRSLIESGEGPLLLNAKVYASADFYMIPALKSIAQIQFERAATDFTAENQNSITEIINTVEFIYKHTPDIDMPFDSGLRGIVLKIIVRHAEKLLDRGQGFSPNLSDVMAECGALGRDFGLAVTAKWRGFHKVQCQQCQHIWADSRPQIPDSYCPGCHGFKHGWDEYPVD